MLNCAVGRGNGFGDTNILSTTQHYYGTSACTVKLEMCTEFEPANLQGRGRL